MRPRTPCKTRRCGLGVRRGVARARHGDQQPHGGDRTAAGAAGCRPQCRVSFAKNPPRRRLQSLPGPATTTGSSEEPQIITTPPGWIEATMTDRPQGHRWWAFAFPGVRVSPAGARLEGRSIERAHGVYPGSARQYLSRMPTGDPHGRGDAHRGWKCCWVTQTGRRRRSRRTARDCPTSHRWTARSTSTSAGRLQF